MAINYIGWMISNLVQINYSKSNWSLKITKSHSWNTAFVHSLEYCAGMANFDEKVHKPQSRSYGRIGLNMQLFYTYLINLSIKHV